MLSKYIKQVFNFKDGDFVAVLILFVLYSIFSALSDPIEQYFGHLIFHNIITISVFLLGIFIGLITGIGQRKFWHGIIYIYICLIIGFVVIPIAENPASYIGLFATKGYLYWTNVLMVISTKYYLLFHFLAKYLVVGLKLWYRKVS